MSLTKDVIAAISKGACSSLLIPAGFRRSAPHFWRDEGGINHAVNFQASAWGSQQSGSFTINLGVNTHALYEGFTGRKFPTNRGTALWPISVRLGRLMPDRTDHWWEVTGASDSTSLGEEVVSALRKYAFPFFDGLRTREQLADWVREPARNQPTHIFPMQVPLILATLAVERGDNLEARSLLGSALVESRGQPFESTVRRVAGRLGVPVDHV